MLKQISIFAENKPGRIKMITNLFKENDIDIRALTLADTKEFGIIRVIVKDSEKAMKMLKEANFIVVMTEVIAISINDYPGSLGEALETLTENGVNIEYMYAFLGKSNNQASIILRVNDNQKATELLDENKFYQLTDKDLLKM